MTQAVAEAPDGLTPFEILLCAFRQAARILEANRPFSEPRLAIIAATPALRERELAKHASLTDALAEALRRRGVPGGPAGLAAQTGWATFHHAAQAWIDDPSQSLDVHLSQAFAELRALSAPPGDDR
ncbi:TetR family transcriptional regulator [Amycolatopsis mongoliensis]|uniref:TetR family transcriptional regulator n=1 Tax=Amycolatopsis mongoliensis TaxID=715475 RepID=A0A9Y2JI82_9PSEU|nr:TetR family transcriptional regulator [Amycolatopsis sp. 4-36]WIX98962.1 TetR family transcriptional regulator [Amycolatopsis sp. 4-36]